MTSRWPGWRSLIATLGLILLATVVLSLLIGMARSLNHPVASTMFYGLAGSLLGWGLIQWWSMAHAIRFRRWIKERVQRWWAQAPFEQRALPLWLAILAGAAIWLSKLKPVISGSTDWILPASILGGLIVVALLIWLMVSQRRRPTAQPASSGTGQPATNQSTPVTTGRSTAAPVQPERPKGTFLDAVQGTTFLVFLVVGGGWLVGVMFGLHPDNRWLLGTFALSVLALMPSFFLSNRKLGVLRELLITCMVMAVILLIPLAVHRMITIDWTKFNPMIPSDWITGKR